MLGSEELRACKHPCEKGALCNLSTGRCKMCPKRFTRSTLEKLLTVVGSKMDSSNASNTAVCNELERQKAQITPQNAEERLLSQAQRDYKSQTAKLETQLRGLKESRAEIEAKARAAETQLQKVRQETLQTYEARGKKKLQEQLAKQQQQLRQEAQHIQKEYKAKQEAVDSQLQQSRAEAAESLSRYRDLQAKLASAPDLQVTLNSLRQENDALRAEREAASKDKRRIEELEEKLKSAGDTASPAEQSRIQILEKTLRETRATLVANDQELRRKIEENVNLSERTKEELKNSEKLQNQLARMRAQWQESVQPLAEEKQRLRAEYEPQLEALRQEIAELKRVQQTLPAVQRQAPDDLAEAKVAGPPLSVQPPSPSAPAKKPPPPKGVVTVAELSAEEREANLKQLLANSQAIVNIRVRGPFENEEVANVQIRGHDLSIKYTDEEPFQVRVNGLVFYNQQAFVELGASAADLKNKDTLRQLLTTVNKEYYTKVGRTVMQQWIQNDKFGTVGFYAYGPSGSGKTRTMDGFRHNAAEDALRDGITFQLKAFELTLQDSDIERNMVKKGYAYDIQQQKWLKNGREDDSWKADVMSWLWLRDLGDPENKNPFRSLDRVTTRGEVDLSKFTTVAVNNITNLNDAIEEAKKVLNVQGMPFNPVSSRSHFFTVLIPNAPGRTALWFVDLAGSEDYSDWSKIWRGIPAKYKGKSAPRAKYVAMESAFINSTLCEFEIYMGLLSAQNVGRAPGTAPKESAGMKAFKASAAWRTPFMKILRLSLNDTTVTNLIVQISPADHTIEAGEEKARPADLPAEAINVTEYQHTQTLDALAFAQRASGYGEKQGRESKCRGPAAKYLMRRSIRSPASSLSDLMYLCKRSLDESNIVSSRYCRLLDNFLAMQKR